MSNKTNNQPIVNVNPTQSEDSQPVLAYRVGELEKASREGFKVLGEKLETLSSHFATHKDIEVAKEQAELEHKAIYEELQEVKRDVEKIKRKTWAQSLLYSTAGAVVALLVAYFINDIAH